MRKPNHRQQKILLLDDEQDLLDLYRDILLELPSKPEVHTTSSGAQAIKILETDPFSLLICDLSMPKMDGLQVLAIVRRKFPQLRTAILTSVADEQFRARAYSMGVDLFLEKPSTGQEIRLMKDCLESLLDQEAQEGFRGFQSKSLVDIIQMEGLSQSSSTLKIHHRKQEGRIWFINGEIIDAETDNLRGEEAFHKILAWRTGSFESAPPDLNRNRTIQASYHALLLESARTIDESPVSDEEGGLSSTGLESEAAEVSGLRKIVRKSGVEFALALPEADSDLGLESWGLDNAEEIAEWTRAMSRELDALGEGLNVGHWEEVQGLGMQRSLGLAHRRDTTLCVGFHRSLSREEMERTMKEILAEEDLEC